MLTLRRFTDEGAWIAAIAADFIAAIEAAEAEGRSAACCLAGGATPEPAYRAMAAALLSRARKGRGPVTLVVGDERASPRGPGELNEAMIRGAFEPALTAGAAALLAWDLGAGADAAVERMAAALAGSRSAVDARGPAFDACYLGLGADGHTAGIFDASRSPDPGGLGIATTSLAPREPRRRVSLTLGTLASARLTRYLIRSAGKEAALRRLSVGDPSCPAVRAASGDAVAFILEAR